MDAFTFLTKLDQTLLLGLRATTIEDLLAGIRSVPDASLYFHTHRFLQQHRYLSPEPPNDFAYWATTALGDDALGERLWSLDLVRFDNIAQLREELSLVLEQHLASTARHVECDEGEEFHFMASRIFVLPTGLEARDLAEFAERLRRVGINSVTFHVFDSRLRLGSAENDFNRWFRSLGFAALVAEMDRLDPYAFTLEGLRGKILSIVERHVAH